ncbi:MAG: serine acetyltransferase [Deltaproteobacteria bacterium]|nr:serine acetyltransferase [Deltaproteobacteria bacterium]
MIIPGKAGLIDSRCFSQATQSLAGVLKQIWGLLQPEIEKSLVYRWKGAAGVDEGAREEKGIDNITKNILADFFSSLLGIRELLLKDIEAAYRGDPAALSYAEVKLAYPGVEAIATHRLAHSLYLANVPLIPRMMSESAHSDTGVDIHPGAKIGQGFFIDHGTGVVIGETTVIGHNVKIYQGVTLGAKSFPLDENGHPIKHIKRHPTVGNNVVIYANATILGGDTVIGDNAVIGGNVFVTSSVAANTMASGKVREISEGL